MSQINKLNSFIENRVDAYEGRYGIAVEADDDWTFEELCELKILVDDTIREKLETRK